MQREDTAVTAAGLARACDWDATPLGHRDTWPRAVEHVVSMLLEAPVPMCYQHGPTLAMVYNDAFAALLGQKHPAAFAAPTREVVAEVWDQPNVGAAFEKVLTQGEPFIQDGVSLRLRRGRAADAALDAGYYLRAGSPVRDEGGAVLGVLHLVLETTDAVNRITAVAELASSLAVAVTVDDVCKVALRHAFKGLPASEVTICLPPSHAGSTWRATRRCTADGGTSADERLPLVWTELEGEALELVGRAAEHRTAPVEAGADVLVLPMPIDERTGVAVLRLHVDHLPEDAHTVLLSLAALVGQALERAYLFDRERNTAEMLQRALLPQTLPQPRSFALAGHYEPVATGAVVGGDFFDAFALRDGRLALVIGDVMGRGVAAATIMGQIRAATRGAALSDPRPESVLSSLDDLVVGLDDLWPASVTVGPTPDHIERGFRGELFVTMLYGLLDTTTGELMLASAGHCPPAVVPSRGPEGASREPGQTTGPRLVDLETGPPLGMRGARPVHTLTLGFGELLLAFTDGLLERRTGTLADGEARLLEMLQELRCDSPLRACKLVLEAMGAGGSFEDDCALLAVRRSPVAHHSESLFVPPLPEAVRPAREWARVLMRAWGIEEGEQFGVVTGLSELVTNAVLHAGTECQVTLELEGSRLTVTVTDTGTRGGPLVSEAPVAGTRGRGLGLVQSISDGFGTHTSARGSTVWFELDVHVQDPVGARR